MIIKYLKVLPCKTGKGVFTTVDIPANYPILEFGGNIIRRSEIVNTDYGTLLQIDLDTYLGPSGSIDDYVNHSCNPNCRIHILGNRAILYSMHLIKADAEITFDYSANSTDRIEDWQMECKCGHFGCRKTISGFQYLDDKVRQNMKNKDMIPLFISNEIISKAFRE